MSCTCFIVSAGAVAGIGLRVQSDLGIQVWKEKSGKQMSCHLETWERDVDCLEKIGQRRSFIEWAKCGRCYCTSYYGNWQCLLHLHALILYRAQDRNAFI